MMGRKPDMLSVVPESSPSSARTIDAHGAAIAAQKGSGSRVQVQLEQTHALMQHGLAEATAQLGAQLDAAEGRLSAQVGSRLDAVDRKLAEVARGLAELRESLEVGQQGERHVAAASC